MSTSRAKYDSNRNGGTSRMLKVKTEPTAPKGSVRNWSWTGGNQDSYSLYQTEVEFAVGQSAAGSGREWSREEIEARAGELKR